MDLTRQSISSITLRCQEESSKFLRGEAYSEQYCLELFRRAIVARDEDAWAAIVVQYRGKVLAWVRRYSSAGRLSVDDDEWVNETFARFWQNFTPTHLDRSLGLAAVLKYLQACVHSSVMDRWRRRELAQTIESQRDTSDSDVDEPAVEDPTPSNLVARELWQAIGEELTAEAERRVIYLSLVLGLKPGEIQEGYPTWFPSIDDVYRTKRNALDRLRRSPKIRQFLE